jgi:hypothetical protein
MSRPIVAVVGILLGMVVLRSQSTVDVEIDVSANRHRIDPRIYGVSTADAAPTADLRAPISRWGGNATSRDNWPLNASNRAIDGSFESIASSSAVPADSDRFISQTKSNGTEPMLTIPMIGSVATDANVTADAAFQQDWIQHLVTRWGTAGNGGVRYYALDNEPSRWHISHRDVHPTGAKMAEIVSATVAYASQIKAVDSQAIVVGPEEWGWPGYFFSGYDQQWAAAHGWSNLPDRSAHTNSDYVPWYLDQLRQREVTTGQRLLDILTVHFYPQGGQYSNDTSTAMQQLRNRSTRALWDRAYVDESWINAPVQLVPRLRNWTATYYPGTKIGITEYSWGAEAHINGATTQADVLGIFGREGLDLATRGTTPDPSSPTYKAIKLYRNYDNAGSAFGDVSVLAAAPNPDTLAVFAAQRTVDAALTIMAINKDLEGAAVNLNVANFASKTSAEAWQLTSSNAITRVPDATIAGSTLAATLPAQSITLFVIRSASMANEADAASDGRSTTTTVSAAAAAGALSGTGNSSTAAVNLTTEGGADWIHWGETPVNRKAGVPALLSTYSAVGTGTIGAFSADLRATSWTDGTPTASSANNTKGMLVWNVGNGFSFTAPAGPTAQTLTVHVGGYYSGGTLTAHLSDGSAPDFVDVPGEKSGYYVRNYVLTYQAATAGQQLTVTWRMTAGPGFVTLNGAALTTAAGVPSMTATAGTPQSTAVSTAFATPLQATVRDASGTPSSGVTVTFTAPASGANARFSGATTATAVTNASGIATAPTLTANGTTGSYVVTASAAGVAAVNFNLTNTTAAPASVSATGGTPQSTAVNTAFATALQATVRDASGTPSSGVTVTFTAPASGASARFGGATMATAVTNASGVATAPALTANGTTGSYVVTASVAGVATAASFSLTNTAAAAGSISATAGTPQSTAVSTTFATALQATVRDASGTPNSGVTVTFTAPASGPSARFGGAATATAVTNASGVATAPALTATSQAGSYAVTASAAGVGSATFNLTNRTSASLVWDANSEPDLAGYRISYGPSSGNHTTTVDVGNVTSWLLTLTTGRYYFVAQAYNTSGLVSAKSSEVMYDAP